MRAKWTMTRRRFIQFGIGGAVLLTTAGTGARWLQRNRRHATNGYQQLRSQDIAFLTAVLPFIIGRHPQFSDHLSTTLMQIDRLLAHSSPTKQSELRDLFDLITFKATQWPVTGYWGNWADASHSDVQEFLLRWRDSRVALLRFGYQGLCQLCHMAWYGSAPAWEAIGYPGPPAFPRSHS
ncbi:MAG: twin-arginine translocation pathway signal protein [Firmicutes bacterium]|nr:twin-arginine translocation pathway signal protein [Gammaproteobacteria bacterium]MCL5051464.1 twin-arginine translocation pathway signal protein [Bacillota bacterium]